MLLLIFEGQNSGGVRGNTVTPAGVRGRSPGFAPPNTKRGPKPPSETPSANKQAEARAASALAGLQARILLVDHIDATAAAYHNAVLVTGLGGLQRITNFHWSNLSKARLLSGAGGQVNPSPYYSAARRSSSMMRRNPSRVWGSLRPMICSATWVRSTCAVPPAMANMRASRKYRSIGLSRE